VGKNKSQDKIGIKWKEERSFNKVKESGRESTPKKRSRINIKIGRVPKASPRNVEKDGMGRSN